MGRIVEIPAEVLDQLSIDQLFLYHLVMAVQSGKSSLFYSGVASKAPGEVHHARWFTRANRVLRLNVSKSGLYFLSKGS